LPKAAGLAEDLKKEFGVECEMIEGRGGVFDVKVNGELVYSKHETGEFPEHAPLIRRIKQLVNAA
jgi:selenoprotein W-related protein